jgi:hypothetical protein
MRAMKSSLVTVVVLLAAVLGFHWVTYPTPHGQTFCVLPKDHLTFDGTFVDMESSLGFALAHPILASRLLAGHGYCLNR